MKMNDDTTHSVTTADRARNRVARNVANIRAELASLERIMAESERHAGTRDDCFTDDAAARNAMGKTRGIMTSVMDIHTAFAELLTVDDEARAVIVLNKADAAKRLAERVD